MSIVEINKYGEFWYTKGKGLELKLAKYKCGIVEYYQHGVLHRNDGPAVSDSIFGPIYIKHGKLCKPAVNYRGTIRYCKVDSIKYAKYSPAVLDRLRSHNTKGAAVIYQPQKYYFIDGVEYDEETYVQMLLKRNAMITMFIKKIIS